MIRTLLAVGLGMIAIGVGTDPTDKPVPRGDALDLLVVGGDKPARLELRVSIDGKPVPAVWDEAFAHLFAFFDRSGNGSLDEAEAARLPSAFALRQVLWGQFTPFTGTAPLFAELDANRDGKVSGAELADHYRRAGLGGVLVGVGKPPATDQLTDALLKHLEAMKNGTAADSLRKLDANDDELIGPGELVDRSAYPGALGAVLLTAPVAGGNPDPIADTFPLLVLPLRSADTHWTKTVDGRRAKDKLPALAPYDLRGVRTAKPAAAWRVAFADGGAELEPVGAKPPANSRLVFTHGSTRLVLRTDAGTLAEQTATARKRFTTQFAECDANADVTLDATELAAPKASQFKHLAAVADRDGDGKLTAKEFAAWLDLQERVAKGHVLLTVLDHGAGLFEILDADHDGSLSVRELRVAWDRMKAAGCVTDGRFDRAKLPRHLIAAVSRGHPQSPLGKPLRTGPAWFLAMDRNGDGDVSRREFIGPAEVFDKLDADEDSLLDGQEAARAAKPR